MKSLVIAIGLKIIVSLNFFKADKAQLNTMRSKKEQLNSCINYPSYSLDCKFAKFSYVERTNMGALQSFITWHKKEKKLLLQTF